MELQVGVKALLKNKEGKYLLVRRSSEKYPEVGAMWDIVGGRIKAGSPLFDNLKREVKEEVNLQFKVTKLFSTGKWKDRELYRFLGDWKGEVKIQEEELLEWNWFTYNEAIKLDLSFDYRKVIEDHKS